MHAAIRARLPSPWAPFRFICSWRRALCRRESFAGQHPGALFGHTVAFTNEQHRRRYAEDADYRARKLADNRAWRVAHAEELSAERCAKYRSDPTFREQQRWQKRMRKYGLDREDYERMRKAQNDACAICEQQSPNPLCVDHCHAFGHVRGLLCNNCNSGLGFFGDDPVRMRAGAAYLERSGRGPKEAVRAAPSLRRKKVSRALAGSPRRITRAPARRGPSAPARRQPRRSPAGIRAAARPDPKRRAPRHRAE
jgi:hypothetical protein